MAALRRDPCRRARDACEYHSRIWSRLAVLKKTPPIPRIRPRCSALTGCFASSVVEIPPFVLHLSRTRGATASRAQWCPSGSVASVDYTRIGGCKYASLAAERMVAMPASYPPKFTVGLVQMSCSTDPEQNLDKAMARTREAAARGAQIVCLQELFRSQYFCREENAELFAPGRVHPRPFHGSAGQAGPRAEDRHRRLAVREARGRPLSQHRRDHRRRGRTAGHLPQDAHPRRSALLTRSSTSRRAISGSSTSTRPTAAWACWSAGISGIPKARASPLSKAPTSCFIPRPSAGIRRRRRSTASSSSMPGAPSSAPTPSPTASMSPP